MLAALYCLTSLRKEATFPCPKFGIAVPKNVLVVRTRQQDGSFLHREQGDLEHVNEEQYATHDGKYQCLVDEIDECQRGNRDHDEDKYC